MMAQSRNPAQRLLAIASRRKLLLALATLLGTALTTLAGLMSPDIYRSEAVVEIEGDKRPVTMFDLTDNTSIKLNKAKLLILSPKVLDGVAETLLRRTDLDLDAAFPARYRVYDIKPRLALVEERLFGHKRPSASIKIRMQGAEAISTLLSYHLLVTIEYEAGSIRVRYEAAEAPVAQEICHLVVERFLQIMGEKDLGEFTAKIAYLEQTIADQDKQMRAVAAQRQELLEKHPELGGGGPSSLVQQYFAKKSELERVRVEREVDQELLESYLEMQAKGDRVGAALSKELRKRLMEELSASEIKLTELTRLVGYQSNHEELIRLRKRNATLRTMLDDAAKSDRSKHSGLAIVAPVDLESLAGEIQRLTQLVRRNDAQSKLLQDELDRMDATRKGSIRLEFELETLDRTLATHETLVKELQTDLEKARIAVAGMSRTTLVTTPPSLPVIPNSLSLPRRVFFGVFVSFMLALSVLFGLDLLQPRVLAERDFLELGIAPLGIDDAIGRATRRIAGSLLALCRVRDEHGQANDRRTGASPGAKHDHRLEAHRGQIILCAAERPSDAAEAFVHRVAAEMRVLGRRVVVVSFHESAEIFDHPCDAHTEFGATFVAVRFPENGFAFLRILDRARANADIVLALVSDLHRLHDRQTIIANVEVLVHIATEGVTTSAAVIGARPSEPGGPIAEAGVLVAA